MSDEDYTSASHMADCLQMMVRPPHPVNLAPSPLHCLVRDGAPSSKPKTKPFCHPHPLTLYIAS